MSVPNWSWTTTLRLQSTNYLKLTSCTICRSILTSTRPLLMVSNNPDISIVTIRMSSHINKRLLSCRERSSNWWRKWLNSKICKVVNCSWKSSSSKHRIKLLRPSNSVPHSNAYSETKPKYSNLNGQCKTWLGCWFRKIQRQFLPSSVSWSKYYLATLWFLTRCSSSCKMLRINWPKNE